MGVSDARGLALDGDKEPGSRPEAELGYGFSVLDGRGVATPYAGPSRSETSETLRLGRASEWHLERAFGGDGRAWTVGYAYRLGGNLELNLDALRREAANDDAPERGTEFPVRMRW